MSKPRSKCAQKSCPAYQEAMRTISKETGQSAQVLYVEPNFMSTPSEYDVFYDCFSSESDYPSDRCCQNSLLCPHYAQKRNTSKKSNKLRQDSGGDGTHILRSSLQQVAYTARVLLKSFESVQSDQHEQNQHIIPQDQYQQSATDNSKIVTAEFQAGDDSEVKELHLDPYTIRIEPVSLNIPLRIELHASPGQPFSAMLGATHDTQFNNNIQATAIHQSGAYCMEPIRTAIIAAPRSMGNTTQLSNMKCYDPFERASRTSTSCWNEQMPLPPNLYEDTDGEQYDRQCLKATQEMFNTDMDPQTVCNCYAAQDFFVSAANISSAPAAPVVLTEQLVVSEKLPADMAKKTSSQIVKPIYQTQASQTTQISQETQVSQQTQSSQTSFRNDLKDSYIQPTQMAEINYTTQSSQTSLVFDNANIIKSGSQSKQSSQISENIELYRPSIQTLSSKVSTELELSLHGEEHMQKSIKSVSSIAKTLEPLSKVESFKEFVQLSQTNSDMSVKEGSIKKSIHSTQSPQPSRDMELLAKYEINKIMESASIQTPLSSEELLMSSKEDSIKDSSKSMQSMQGSKSSNSHEREDLSLKTLPTLDTTHSSSDEAKKSSFLRGIQLDSMTPSIKSNSVASSVKSIETQTRRSDKPIVPKKPAVSGQYRLAYPQHKEFESCAPCRFDPSPLQDENGRIFCPGNCGCCMCPWRVRSLKYTEESNGVNSEKLKICKCIEKGTIFTTFNDNERQCDNTEDFDMCPCREKAAAKFLEMFGQEMWSENEELSIIPDSRVVQLSDVSEIYPRS